MDRLPRVAQNPGVTEPHQDEVKGQPHVKQVAGSVSISEGLQQPRTPPIKTPPRETQGWDECNLSNSPDFN